MTGPIGWTHRIVEQDENPLDIPPRPARLQRLLGQAIDACGRVIDPRQIELSIDTEAAA